MAQNLKVLRILSGRKGSRKRENNVSELQATKSLKEIVAISDHTILHDDTSTVKAASELNVSPNSVRKKPLVALKEGSEHPPTSYFTTIVHLFKGNIGPGVWAMGYAFKNGGLLVAPILTVVIALICVHTQHVLINCSKRMREITKADVWADYAETVEQCFQYGPVKLRGWSKTMRTVVNIFICVTQLGFCCIYFVFISTNVRQILKAYDINLDVRLVMVAAFVPIVLTSLITNLKWLTPVSLLANICMITGMIITMYFALKDGLPDVSERHLSTSPLELSLFFGTTIFAFEGIALVLPLKNAMQAPNDFERPLGVLNIGMFFVTLMFMSSGFLGYVKWGESTAGSLTLNLGDSILAQCVKVMVSMGVMFGYPIQFFIAIQIMLPWATQKMRLQNQPVVAEYIFRILLVMLTLAIAEMVPALGLFISLIGALCSTALALVFPPVIELLITDENKKSPGCYLLTKNFLILVLALMGFSVGTYESLYQIITHLGEELELN